MTTGYTTGNVIRRALDEAPALRKGLRLTLFLAVAGQAITVVTPIVMQQIIDKEILNPDGIEIVGVVQKASIALVALVVGVFVGRSALLRLVRTSSTGLSDLRTKTFGHILRRSALHVQAERRGNLVSRVTSDISTLQEFMEWGGIGPRRGFWPGSVGDGCDGLLRMASRSNRSCCRSRLHADDALVSEDALEPT